MRPFVRNEIPRDFDYRLVRILQDTNAYLEQVDKGFASIQRGEKPVAGGSLPYNALSVTDHHLLNNMVANDDHTQYALLAGRTTGQTLTGATKTTTAGTDLGLTLRAITSSASSKITLLDENVVIEGDTIFVRSVGKTDGIFLAGGTFGGVIDFINASWKGSLGLAGVGGASNNVLFVDHTTDLDLSAATMVVRKRNAQTGHMLDFRDNASAVMSHVRASDGAFVGPVVVSGGTGSFVDSGFQIVGSGDSSKIAMFEVDGITTGTTRTLTVPNFDGTLALFRSDKLRIGDTTAPTHRLELIAGSTTVAPLRFVSGALLTSPATGVMEYNSGVHYLTNSAATRHRIALSDAAHVAGRVPFNNGTSAAMTNSVNLTFDDNASGTLSCGTFYSTISYTGVGDAFGLLVSGKSFMGVGGDDGYSWVLQADRTLTGDIGNAAAMFAILRAYPSVDTAANYLGFDGGVEVKGDAEFIQTGPGLGAVGLRGVIENENVNLVGGITALNGLIYTKTGHGTTTNAYGMANRWAHTAGHINNAFGFYVSGDVDFYGATADNVYGVYIAAQSGGGTANWSLYSVSGNSALGGKLAVGSTTAPTNTLHVTGTVSASSLTSGRVVFAGTSGLLADDADFTFATDTLTITKIAATTLTGLLTFADAIDIAFNGTTGTKIGTATSQKLGFWNTAPIIQPTTAVAAATFVTNTSLIANDTATFDGYTIGQVVRALRNAGLLA